MKKLIAVLLALVMLLAFAACDAKTEPVRDSDNANNSGTQDDTQPADGEPIIIGVTVYHGDGETSSSRLSTTQETLAAALLERTFITEDMLTVDGEKADPANGAYWTLYIDGVYATETWDNIILEDGLEYMFEYTLENTEEVPEEGVEGAPEDIPENEAEDVVEEDVIVDPEA